jgi:hypothetical protein
MGEALKLRRRPEARSFSVEVLLQLVQDGRLRIPEFQRPQRWRAPHVRSLFDSVARGFPIGELLFAKQEVGAGVVRFGSIRVVAPAAADALLIVDGQQRMSALAGALLHPSPQPRADIHALWYDLELETFEHLVRGEPPHHWIPLNVVGDSFKLLNWLSEWPLHRERPELARRAIALGTAVREFQVPATIVDGASEETLRLIFKRVNTSGVPMRETEVFDALYGRRGRPVTAACARLAEMGFGVIAETIFLAALKFVAGIDPRRRFNDSEPELALDAAVIDRTEAALRRTFTFLVGPVGIPVGDLLPFPLPLIVLARAFHFHPDPDARTESLLSRWVWRGALTGCHADDRPDVLATLQGIVAGDPAFAAEALNDQISGDLEFPRASTLWDEHTVSTLLCALALFALSPLDPRTGSPFTAEHLQALLEERSLSDVFVPLWVDQDGASRVVHRFFLGTEAALDSLFHPTDPPSDEVLASHALDRAMVAMFHAGDLAGFEQARAARLDAHIVRFCRERAAIGESDRPAIAAIVARVEAEAAK